LKPSAPPAVIAGDDTIIAARWSDEKAREKATFCEQKVAKKLCYFGPGRFGRHRPKQEEVFSRF
jgi:hypothetical protein